jgi:hypothetical protein
MDGNMVRLKDGDTRKSTRIDRDRTKRREILEFLTAAGINPDDLCAGVVNNAISEGRELRFGVSG